MRNEYRMNDHEILFIKSFIIKERQSRYLNLISTKKGRSKLRGYISHFKDLQAIFCRQSPSYDKETFHSVLRSKGAIAVCYIISEHSDYDQKELSLDYAVEKLYNSGISYFMSCIPGRLVYYAGEDPKCSYFLER